jgi:hypothetical protein
MPAVTLQIAASRFDGQNSDRCFEVLLPIRAEPWAQDVYLSPGDAGRFFASAAEATLERKFNVVYATNRPNTPKYDLDTTKRLLGWEPSESWPQGIEVIIGK